MKSRCCFILLLVSYNTPAMSKTGKYDTFYSSLIELINTGQYEKAHQLFNQRTKKEFLPPEQISALTAAIRGSELHYSNPSFYQYLEIFLSIYSDALHGRLLINEYMDAIHKKHTQR